MVQPRLWLTAFSIITSERDSVDVTVSKDSVIGYTKDLWCDKKEKNPNRLQPNNDSAILRV